LDKQNILILWQEYFQISLIKFLKKTKNRILTARIQKIFIGTFRPQRTQRKGGIKVLGFILGAVFGGTVGVFAMCLCKAASEADKCMNQTDFKD
jgi:hypothetical protein